MTVQAYPIIVFILALRLLTLVIAMRNERRLRAEGAVEYGVLNSRILAVLHGTFYLSCIFEAYQSRASFDILTIIGIGLFVISALSMYVVIRDLGGLWTVKIMIAKGHKLKRSFLYEHIRHPNYFLNILPELIAIVLIAKAWTTLIICLPLYLVSLGIRILQEEAAMREVFENY